MEKEEKEPVDPQSDSTVPQEVELQTIGNF